MIITIVSAAATVSHVVAAGAGALPSPWRRRSSWARWWHVRQPARRASSLPGLCCSGCSRPLMLVAAALLAWWALGAAMGGGTTGL